MVVGAASAVAIGISTASITWMMPLSVAMSVMVTVLVFINKLSPFNDKATLPPFTVSTVVPARPIAASALTLPETT